MSQQPAKTTQKTDPTGFHIGQWGSLGWVETILRGGAALIGIATLSGPFTAAGLTIGGNPHLGAVIVLALLTLPLFLVIGLRFQQREVISIVFTILVLFGHIALLIALLQVPASVTLAALFGVLGALGLAAKDRFLRTTGYTEMGQNSASFIRANLALIAVHIVFVVALLV